jgi:predicted transcriptional regulator
MPERIYSINNTNIIKHRVIEELVLLMRQENVTFFTDKQEELTDLLIALGIQRNISKVLVFLATTPQATSRVIERGADMRQPEVSIAMQYLVNKGWIVGQDSPAETKGRPMKIYELAIPFAKIVDQIESEKKSEAKKKLARVRQLRNFVK